MNLSKVSKNLVWLSCVLFIAACASSSPYRAANGSGYGYTDKSLGEDRYRITFKMRGDDVGESADYAMRRAAELTLLEGKEWFVVTSRSSDIEREPASTSVVSTPTTVDRDCGLVACKTTVRQGTPVVTSSVPGREEIETFLEIKMGDGQMPESADAYDAQSVRSNR